MCMVCTLVDAHVEEGACDKCKEVEACEDLTPHQKFELERECVMQDY